VGADVGDVNPWINKGVAFGGLVAVTLLNASGELGGNAVEQSHCHKPSKCNTLVDPRVDIAYIGEYVVRAFVGADVGDVNPWINKGVAFGGLVAVKPVTATIIPMTVTPSRATNLKNIKKSPMRVANLVEMWKTTGWFEGTNTEISDFAVALYAGLWAFDGWDNVSRLSSTSK
jgi:hypothetical protein